MKKIGIKKVEDWKIKPIFDEKTVPERLFNLGEQSTEIALLLD